MSKSMKSTGERSFTIESATHVDGCPTKFSHKDYTGRYVAHRPAHAAGKAMTNLCNVKKVRGQCTLFIKMRETTQGSANKVFGYHVKRVKYDDAVDVSGGKREYYNLITKGEAPHCKRSHKSSGPMRGSKRSHKSSSESNSKKTMKRRN